MRISVRSAAQSLLVTAAVVSGSAVIGVTTTLAAEVALNAAVTPLIVPGTGTPKPQDVPGYMENAVAYYVDTSGACGAEGCTDPVAVPYIAQFWPFPFEGWGGLEGAKWNVSVASGVTRLTSELVGANNPGEDHPVVIFGYSQGATVSSIVKGQLADLPDEEKGYLTFVLIGNPNRPDGGLFERLAILGTVPILDATFGQPTPTDTGIDTYDIALTYDGVADSPSWVLNPLAIANALAGFEYVHGTYLAPDDNEPATATPYGYTPAQVQAAIENAKANCTEQTHCQLHGDTRYITLPAKTLPIMQPFLDLGAATGTSALVIPLVDLISPMAQTLIETGYTRTDYSKPTPFQLLPRVNPVRLVADLINDIPEGIDAARNPGLDPLPGWTDPTTDTVQSQEDAGVEVAAVTAVKANGTQADVTQAKGAGANGTQADVTQAKGAGANGTQADVTETKGTGADGTGAAATTAAAKSEGRPLTRLSVIARPGEGLAVPGKPGKPATENGQRSPRTALGIKGHPVRDFAKSLGSTVRKALGQDTTDKQQSEPAA